MPKLASADGFVRPHAVKDSAGKSTSNVFEVQARAMGTVGEAPQRTPIPDQVLATFMLTTHDSDYYAFLIGRPVLQ